MPRSTLTVRTLALATVAFVLACGHAVQAMGAQKAAAELRGRQVPSSVSSPVRVVPAGSGHSTVATFSNGSGGAHSGGGSQVATFTSTAGGGSKSIVTFVGDHVDQSKTVASSSRSKPQQPSKRKPGLLQAQGDPPVIAVRRVSDPANAPNRDAVPPLMGPPAPDETPAAVAAKPAPRIRNAFAGLSSRAAADGSGAPLVYAHASAR